MKYLFGLCFLFSPVMSFAASPALSHMTIQSANSPITFYVEIAKTPQKQEKGLMERKNLPEHAGMLFVYDNPTELAFWMKNTLIPLDILFIDASKKIIDIQTMTPCHQIQCPIYTSKKPAKYALEINAGLSKKYHLDVGNSITFNL